MHSSISIKGGLEIREIEKCVLMIKIAILGIVVLAVITVALMPSPGNLWNPVGKSKVSSASQSLEALSQTLAESGTATQPAAEPAKLEAVYTTVTVEPEQVVVTVNQTFSVQVWISNVTGMAGWDIRLFWNREIVKCVDAQANTPLEWGGVSFDWFNKTESDVDVKAVYTAWQFGSGIENDYSDTLGRYFKAECVGPRDGPYYNSFNGSIAIVTLTFQALQAGSTSLSLEIDSCEGILIGDRDAMPIANTVSNGVVEVQAA